MPVLLFFLYVIVEVAALVWLGSSIGVLATVAWLIGLTVLGGFLLQLRIRGLLTPTRRQGVGSIAQSVVLLIAALLIVVPGIVTSALGIALMIPPVTKAVAAILTARTAASVSRFATRLPTTAVFGPQFTQATQTYTTRTDNEPTTIDGTVLPPASAAAEEDEERRPAGNKADPRFDV